MAIDPRLLQAPGDVPPINTAVADLDRRVRGLEAARSTIGVGTITGGSTGTGVATGHLAIGAVTAEIIQAGAVDTVHLHADSIDTIHLKTDSVTAIKIKSDEIDTRHLKTDSITSVKIQSDQILARHLSAEVTSAGWLDAGVITSDKLLVSSGGNNLLKNGHFARVTGAVPDYWGLYNNALSPAGAFDSIVSASARYGPRMARLINSTDTTGQLGVTTLTTADEPAVQGSKPYTLTGWVQPLTGTANYRVHIHWRDSLNAIIGSGNPSALTAATAGGWTKIKVTATSPSNAVKAKVYAWADNPASGSTHYVGAMLLQEGDLPSEYLPAVEEVLPGTILGEHIGALEVDTVHLKAGSVDTTKLHADSVNTIHLITDSVDARVIKADAVTSVEILAGQVQTGHMSVNTISGDRITTNTLDGGKITANTILADRMNVSQLSAITANMGALTAGSITGATVQTAAPGGGVSRVWIDSTGLKMTNAAGETTLFADASIGKITALAGVGGGNLLYQTSPNAAEVAAASKWSVTANATIAVETTTKLNDFNTWKLSITGASGIQGFMYNDYTTDQVIPTVSGEEFTFSAWIKTSVASRTPLATIIFYDASNVAVQTTHSSGGPGPQGALVANTWSRRYVTATAPATAAKVRVLVYTSSSANQVAGEVFYIGGLQLERGSVPTAYGRRPDEIQANEVGGLQVAPLAIEGTANGGAGHIGADTVGVNELFVNNLAAINADLGTITAGTITATASVNAAAVNAGVMSADRITLQVGTGNLFSTMDPSFEDTGTASWVGSTGVSSIAVSSTFAAYGTQSLRTTANNTATFAQVRNSVRVKINPALKYSVSAMWLSTIASRQGRIIFEWYNAQTGGSIVRTDSGPTVDLTTLNAWTRVAYENILPPATAVAVHVYFRYQTTGGNVPLNELSYIDGVMLNEGEKAAAFTMFGPDQILRTQILPGEIRANHIGVDQVNATHIDVTDLAAINANLGTVTAGTVTATVSVSADAIDADTLEAITADLGTVTAGTLSANVLITGATIQTAPLGQNRVLLDTNGLSVMDAAGVASVNLPVTGAASFTGAIDADGGITQDAVTSVALANSKHAWYAAGAEAASIFGTTSAYPGVSTPRLFASATAPMSYDTLVKSSANLVHYWRMDNATSLADQVATSPLTLPLTQGSVLTPGAGLISGVNKSITNNTSGAGSFSAAPGAAQNVTTGLSVEYWVRLDKTPVADVRLAQRSTNTDGSSAEYWKSTYIASTGKIQFSILIGGVAKTHTTATALTAGLTYHVVHTYDNVNIKSYLNGVADGTAVGQAGSIDAQGTTAYRVGAIAALDPKTGPNNAGTGANTVIAGPAWTSPGSILTSDNTYASVSPPTNGGTAATDQLWATNFGFALPTTATVRGVIIDVEQKAASIDTANGHYVYIGEAKLIKGGAVVGSNQAPGGVGPAAPTTDTYKSIGTNASLWGTTLTPAEVNASNFGVSLRASNRSLTVANTLSVDHVRMTVYYWQAITLDEVAVYNAALTPSVITDHYQTGTTGVSASVASVNRQVVGADGTSDFMDNKLVSTLPVAPYDGQVIQYQTSAMATDGVKWTLQYRAGSASAYKWEFIGGSAWMARIDTNSARASTAYGDRATVGPDVTVPLAGDYYIRCGCHAWSGAYVAPGWLCLMSYAVGATAASDNWSAQNWMYGLSQNFTLGSQIYRHNGVAAASLIRGKYRGTNGGATDYQQTFIEVVPIRVG